MEEHPHHLESTVPHLAPLLQDANWPSDTPTAPLSCVTTADGNVNGSGNDNVKVNASGVAEVVPGGGNDAKERARPKSAASSSRGLNVVGRFSFDPKHGRRNSFRQSRGGSLKGDVLSGKLSKSTVGLYSLAGGSSRSPTNAKLARDGSRGVDGDDERLSQDGNLYSGGEMGAFEGLKWGEYVQFKMPAEEEVRQQ